MTDASRGRATVVQATLASLAVIAFLFVFVFPTRTYLHQRRATDGSKAQLDLLHQQTAHLEQEAARLQSDAEVERIARDRYNFVMPGEQAWAVIPPLAAAGTTTTVPPPTTTVVPPAPKPAH